MPTNEDPREAPADETETAKTKAETADKGELSDEQMDDVSGGSARYRMATYD